MSQMGFEDGLSFGTVEVGNAMRESMMRGLKYELLLLVTYNLAGLPSLRLKE